MNDVIRLIIAAYGPLRVIQTVVDEVEACIPELVKQGKVGDAKIASEIAAALERALSRYD